jgi:hypothetical protein
VSEQPTFESRVSVFVLRVPFLGRGRRSQYRGSGTLQISPEHVRVQLDRFGQAMTKVLEVCQTTSPVDVVHARLVPPWMNRYLLVRQDERTAEVNIVDAQKRERILTALSDAGWEVRLHSTWVTVSKVRPDASA